MPHLKGWGLWVGSLISLFLVFALALRIGAVADLEWGAILSLRLPRALMALAVGLGLAVAGATLQAVFSNPLCEPYTLGISSGAALGAVAGAMLGLPLDRLGTVGAALAGALAFALVLQMVSWVPGATTLSLLLAGVMLGLVGSSLVTLCMAVGNANGLQGAIFWLMGDLSRARLGMAMWVGAGTLVCSILIWRQRRALDALLLGEEDALSVGVDVPRARAWLLLLTSVLVAICVSGAGMIGFVGLVVPHFARKLVGSLHGRLLPLTALWGAIVLILADAIGRAAASPFELPVGVVTALTGAPLFAWILLRRGRDSA